MYNVLKFIASDHLLHLEDCTAQEWKHLLSIMIFISFRLPDYEAVPLYSFTMMIILPCIPMNRRSKGPFLSTLTRNFHFLLVFLVVAILPELRFYLIMSNCDYDCICLMVSDVDHLLATCESSFEKCLFRLFAYYLIYF